MEQRNYKHLVIIGQNGNTFVSEIVIHETTSCDYVDEWILGECISRLKSLSVNHLELARRALVIWSTERIHIVFIHELLVDTVEVLFCDYLDIAARVIDFKKVFSVEEVYFIVLLSSKCFLDIRAKLRNLKLRHFLKVSKRTSLSIHCD